MNNLAVLIFFILCALATQSPAQIAAASAGSPAPAKKAEKQPKEKAKNKEKKKEDKSSGTNLFGSSATGPQSNQPTTTEIYADEAFFDSTKNMGIFTGRVKVVDPRFNLQSEKLTVFITKGQNQSLEKAIAEGNVGLIRDRPAANGGPPTRAVGRSDKATYTASTGDVELVGTPRVQEGPNLHVATSPDTVMVIGQNSQLRTHGPSRTEIVQQANDEKKGQGSPTPAPAAQAPAAPAPAAQAPAAQASPAPSLPKP
jgi:lipopolysaccharide transport protein LptA